MQPFDQGQRFEIVRTYALGISLANGGLDCSCNASQHDTFPVTYRLLLAGIVSPLDVQPTIGI